MKWIFFCVIIFFVADCKQPYNPPVKSPSTGYLVVEGFINSGSSGTSIQLTRTTKLIDTTSIIYEHGALLTIESNASDSFALSETGNGVYTSGAINLNLTEQYRLRIQASNGEQYLSDFVSPKITPPIDSVNWVTQSDGVQIYVNTHDPQNVNKYYLWNYDETWEIHSAFQSNLEYAYDATGKPISVQYKYPNEAIDTTIYKCWSTQSSTNINIASTEKLNNAVITLQPLVFIQQGTRELSVLYSINVKQHALSEAAYNFYQEMQSNTENLGSIFDPQPSQPQGNIHCLTNPSEVVIGYVDVSTEQSQRIFISNNDVPNWDYSSGCQFIIITNNPDSIRAHGISLEPTFPNTINRATEAIIDFAASQPSCVDCTLFGTNVKPVFWP
jgi:hypothetical protein